ncbi:hypothetical protein [uncultured Adlercreutzia sp.]|uniref:hypothetical protein n=1 Tax=uncultured Adlercreutzia sp. TaxID=875803 RepID=UPI0026768061|nr:hypothetical protein [uncultured Adlercreutzia sp.]
MSRPDYSCYDDEPRRPQGGLSLSTGRLEGRPRSAADARRTRHNPLRDDYTDHPAPHRGSSRAGASPTRQRPAGAPNRSRGASRGRGVPASHGSHRDDAAASPRGSRTRHSGLAKAIFTGAASPFAPKAHAIGSHGSAPAGIFAGGLNVRRIGAAALVGAVAIILVMAIAHVGPFAPAAEHDGTKHVGVLGANAVQSTGAAIGQSVATQVSLARPVEPDLAKLPAHTPTREEITALPDQTTPFAFALSTDGDAAAPELSERSLTSLDHALAYYNDNGYEAGYLLMDLGTGRGIAGNLDASIYGASSFKGPYCAYVVNKEFPNDINRTSSTRLAQVENTIVWSDNSSYGKLRRTYGTDGMEEWLSEAGVNTALVNDTYFPHYTTRQSALMWLKIYDYLTTADTSAAQWLSDVFARTEVSFLRNGASGTTSEGHTDYLPEEGSGTEEGVEEGAEGTEAEAGAEDDGAVEAEADAETDAGKSVADLGEALVSVTGASDAAGDLAVAVTGEPDLEADGADPSDEGDGAAVASIGSNITVRNKAGWIDGEEDDAVCDSGIVTINDRDYLMVVMTNAPDSAEGEQAFARLARTLFEIRSDLV